MTHNKSPGILCEEKSGFVTRIKKVVVVAYIHQPLPSSMTEIQSDISTENIPN